MKRKILLIILLLGSLPVLAQVGQSWQPPERMKKHFTDSSYFAKDVRFNSTIRINEGALRIGLVTITANGAELNLLDGALVNTNELNNLVGVTGKTGTGNLVLSASPTFSGTVSLGSGNLTMTGSLAATGSRVLKGWFSDLEITNLPTINGGSFKAALAIGQTDVTALPDTLLTRYTKTQVNAFVRKEINDSLNAAKTGATLAVALPDSNMYDGGYATPSRLLKKVMRFIVGNGGAPGASDSLIINPYISESQYIKLFRGGDLQYLSSGIVNTIDSTFRINGDTITVRPVFTNNEKIIIELHDPTYWQLLSYNQDLLDSLVGYWKLDETSGTTVYDALGSWNGTTVGDVNQDGIYGRSIHSYAASDYIATVPYSSSKTPGGNTFSISFWFWLDSIPTDVGRSMVFFAQNNSGASPSYSSITINSSHTSPTNRVRFYVKNSTPTTYDVYSSTELQDSTWYHAVAVNQGDGLPLKMYINGVDVSTAADIMSGECFQADSYTVWGDAYINAGSRILGRMDELAIFSSALTPAQVKKLYNAGQYPFE